MRRRLFYFFLTLSFHISVFPQVTIGSADKPADGALLQLKNLTTNSGNELINATKGLSLPRVELTSLTELYPMFKDADEDYNSVSNKDIQKEKHMGLMVYNSNECLEHSGLRASKGIYV